MLIQEKLKDWRTMTETNENIKKEPVVSTQVQTYLQNNDTISDKKNNSKSKTTKQKTKKKASNKKEPSGVILSIMQYEKNPDTGEPLLDEEKIIKSLKEHESSIEVYAYISHEEDVVSFDDIAEQPWKNLKIGELKPKHWHIALKLKYTRTVKDVASWFNLEPQFVEVVGQKKRLPTNIRFDIIFGYLIHIASPEKHQYNCSKVRHSKSFDYEDFIIQLKTRSDIKTHKKSIEIQLTEVLKEGKSLAQVRSEIGEEEFAKHRKDFQKNREEYLYYYAEKPKARINIYICGRGGSGKTILTRELANRLLPIICPNLELKSDEEKMFEIKAKGVTFKGYDGQPVLILNDIRSFEMFSSFESRNNIFNLFDTFPNGTINVQNVKYGHAVILNYINIINSAEYYIDFLDGLVRDDKNEFIKNEDNGQSYRRFPIVIDLTPNYYEVLVNEYYLGISAKPTDYEVYGPYEYRLAELYADTCGDKELMQPYIDKAVDPIIEIIKNIYHETITKKLDTLQLAVKYANIGKQLNKDELHKFKKGKTI